MTGDLTIMQAVAALLLLAVFGGACWSLLGPHAEFVVFYARGTVRFQGRLPLAKRPEVVEFLKREFIGQKRIIIYGVKARPARLRIVVRGVADDGDRQRIRNFFQTL